MQTTSNYWTITSVYSCVTGFKKTVFILRHVFIIPRLKQRLLEMLISRAYLVWTVTTESPKTKQALQPGSHTFGVGSPFLLLCPLLAICNVAGGPLMCCCMFSWLSCCHDLKSVEAVKYRFFLYVVFPIKHPTLCFVVRCEIAVKYCSCVVPVYRYASIDGDYP